MVNDLPRCACCRATAPATKRVISGSIIRRPVWRRHRSRHYFACSIFCARELDAHANPEATPTYESVNMWEECEEVIPPPGSPEPEPEPPPPPPPLPPLRCAYCRVIKSKIWLHHPLRNMIACSTVCARNLDKRVAKLRRTPLVANSLWKALTVG